MIIYEPPVYRIMGWGVIVDRILNLVETEFGVPTIRFTACSISRYNIGSVDRITRS